MKLLQSTIFLIFLCLNLYSQPEYKSLAQKLTAADSIWIVNYASYDSTRIIRQIIKDGPIYSTLPKAIHPLRSKVKSEFISILKKENSFRGRYGTLSGFFPRQAVILWAGARYLYFEISLPCHKIFAGPGFDFEWLHIDPNKADDLHDFFRGLGIIKIPEIIN